MFVCVRACLCGRQSIRVLRGLAREQADPKKSASALERAQALNCVRMLTRVMPVLFEVENDPFVDTLFWQNTLPDHAPPTEFQQVAAKRCA